MARTLPKPNAYPKSSILAAGPVVGCRDATDPTTADPTLARSMQNMVRGNGPQGSAIVGRPGTVQMGAPLGAIVQAGAFTWTLGSGLRQTIAVVDGQVFVYDWAADSWAVIVSSANLATAGGALSVTARVALVPFGDRLVISDGVHFALWWDGSSGAGGLIVLPAKFFGPPTVYYSKLMGVDPDRRYVMYWSEEGDATIGYDITVGPYTYNNAWDNPGGYNDPLTVVVGTNDGLYVFRARNSLAILGAVSASFQTAGTHANISVDIGTLSPWGVHEVAQGVFIVDADAQPWIVKIGALQPLPLWKDCQQVLQDVPRLSMPNATAVYDEATAVIVLGLASSGVLGPSRWIVFHADDLQYQGYWFGWRESMSAGTVVDQYGVKRWSHADASGGRIVAHGSPQSGPWTDSVGGVPVAIAHEVISPFLGYDPTQEFLLSQADVGFTAGTSVTVGYQTSRGYGSFNTFTLTSSGLNQFILGVSLLGTGILGSKVFSSQASAGLAGRGRWASLIVRHNTFNEPFGVDVMRFRIGITQGNPRQP